MGSMLTIILATLAGLYIVFCLFSILNSLRMIAIYKRQMAKADASLVNQLEVLRRRSGSTANYIKRVRELADV